MALAAVVDLLVCPLCRQPFTMADGRVLRCTRSHAFDVARQGYVNLLATPAPRNADNSAMVMARERFLSGGSYRQIADRVEEQVADHPHARALEVGAGTGYYLSRLLDVWPTSRGLALDVSVAAARRAARAHPRLGSIVADGWRPLPVADGSIDLVLDVFAPRNAEEFARVLTDGGVVVTVTPEPEHLAEIRTPLGLLEIQPDKRGQLRDTLAVFTETSSSTLTYPISLTAASLHDLVAMGPNAFHLTEPAIVDLISMVVTPLTVTVAVRVSVWSSAA